MKSKLEINKEKLNYKILGFTLIELLAVIVILAIIALIATPLILKIINNAREESNKRSIELYAEAVKNSIVAYQLINPNAPKMFTDLNVEYDGDIECRIKELYEDGGFYLEGCKVNKSEKEYSYGTKKDGDKPCTLEDLDKDGVASLSDIITCGTESFYVMTNKNNEITMLSMYNLYVGYVKTYDENWSNTLTPIENPTNKQSEIAKGWGSGESKYYGLVAFSSFHVYFEQGSPTYIYNKNADIIYPYVSEYERILREELNVKSAKATLIRYQQLAELGCDLEKQTCGPDNGYGALEKPAPSWVYSTTYWTGSVVFNDLMIYIDAGYGIYFSYAEENEIAGVRPVVTISASEI